MEPDDRYVKPFIRPLLDKPGSRYIYTDIAGVHPKTFFMTFEALVRNRTFDFEPFLPQDDPPSRQLNTNILVTGSLARRFGDYLSSNSSATPVCDLAIQHMTWTSLLNQTYHRSGPVRQLWWFPEVHKHWVVPRRPLQKSSFNVGLHLGADITEAAGTVLSQEYLWQRGEQSTASAKTHPAFVREGANIVEKRMGTAGMAVPRGRETLTSAFMDAEAHDFDMESPLSIRHQSLSELEAEIATVKDRMAKVVSAAKWSKIIASRAEHSQDLMELRDTLDYPQCDYVVPAYSGVVANRKERRMGIGVDSARSVPPQPPGIFRLVQLMDLQLRIINLEVHCKHFEDEGEDVTRVSAQVIALDEAFRDAFGTPEMGRNTVPSFVLDLVMDQQSFFADPQQMAFDRRPYEPLKAHPNDFWPRHALCLLDVVPKNRDLSVPDIADQHEGAKIAQELLKYLFANKSQRLIDALDKIAPNAAKDLIPMVPSFSDPRKGGRLNINAMRVRMLSEEMVEGLVKAWHEWPFKSSAWELALATGNLSGSGDEMFSVNGVASMESNAEE